jgi:hypothetical protein
MEKQKIITLKDWQNILYKMNYYKLENGFIDYDLFGNLTFFVDDPKINFIHACPITKKEVLQNINTLGWKI